MIVSSILSIVRLKQSAFEPCKNQVFKLAVAMSHDPEDHANQLITQITVQTYREQKMTNTQGSTGSAYEERDDRPRALRYAAHARSIEQTIMDALPKVVAKLVSMAEEGNVAAAKYLVDRIHGRPAKLASAAVGDTSLTYRHQDWSADLVRQQAKRDEQARIALLSISQTADRREQMEKEIDFSRFFKHPRK